MKSTIFIAVALSLLAALEVATAQTAVVSFSFTWVWQIEVDPWNDRKPTEWEVIGVADATGRWLTDVLSAATTAIPPPLRLQQVTATAAWSQWDPQGSPLPHAIRLDCLLSLEADSAANLPQVNIREVLSYSISRDDQEAFVTDYLRQTSSVFQYSRTSATYMLQVTDNNGNPLAATVTLAPETVTKPTLRPTTRTSITLGRDYVNATPRPTLRPTLRANNNSVLRKTPVKLSYGGLDAARQPTGQELQALLAASRDFLSDSLQRHYAKYEPDAQLERVAMQWSQRPVLNTDTIVLVADIILVYDSKLPSQQQTYYSFLLNDMIKDNSSDYILNRVRLSGPADSIFRSVREFSWDFNV